MGDGCMVVFQAVPSDHSPSSTSSANILLTAFISAPFLVLAPLTTSAASKSISMGRHFTGLYRIWRGEMS